MRVEKLKLLRYGKFTDRVLQFPQSSEDLHVIYGANEAGKSTARQALEDFLFGIPMRSNLDFLHAYSDMQIGVALRHEKSTLDAVRHKGSSNTLTDIDRKPIEGGEATLERFMGHADRDFYLRMFSLDHARLREGGQSILDEDDDVGKAIFSASAGLTGLREILKEWETQTDQLWGPRKSMKRAYYKAKDKFDQAAKDVRELSVSSTKWADKHNEYETTQEQVQRIKERIRNLSPQLRKIQRIRRTKHNVHRLHAIEPEIEELGSVIDMPVDAKATLDQHEQALRLNENDLESVKNRIERFQKSLDELSYDQTVLDEADNIARLAELRVQLIPEEIDLPKRKQELELAQQRMKTLAEKMGWFDLSVTDIVSRMPPRGRDGMLRVLIDRHTTWQTENEGAERELQEVSQRCAALKRELENLGSERDLKPLQAAIRSTQNELDSIGSDSRRLQQDIDRHNHEMKRLQESLNPRVDDTNALANMPVPAQESIDHFRNQFRDLAQKQQSINTEIRTKQARIESEQHAIEQLVIDEAIVTEPELQKSRKARDSLWQTIKQAIGVITGQPTSVEPQGVIETEELAERYELEVVAADDLADRRFGNAEANAQLLQRQQACEILRHEIESLQRELEHLEQEKSELNAAWHSLWGDTPFDLADPENMTGWNESLRAFKSEYQQRENSTDELKRVRDAEESAHQSLSRALAEVGREPETGQLDTVSRLIEYARQVEVELTASAAERKSLTRNLDEASLNLKAKQDRSQQLKDKLETWQSEWTGAMQDVAFVKSDDPKEVAGQLDQLGDLRVVESEIDQLARQRIATIERDLNDFEHQVRTMVKERFCDLEESDSKQAVIQLRKQLEISVTAASKSEDLRRELAHETEQQDHLSAQRIKIEHEIEALKVLAGAQDVLDLKKRIAESDKHRELTNRLEEVRSLLLGDSDGLSIDELKAESDSFETIEDVIADEDRLNEEMNGLRDEQQELGKKELELKRDLEYLPGQHEAGEKEFEKEVALAEMKRAIESYVPLKASTIVLNWAIEKFQKEKQDPILTRASEIFKTLTLDSFTRLELQIGVARPALIALRSNGNAVAVQGLSEGTADQLYLALRLAAIEDYVKQSKAALPLVVDDLFTTFDDDRARAGFEVLHELSRTCQVLFFTHHQHLVEIVQSILGEELSVHSI